MSGLIHVNPETGETGYCKAKKGGCPFGGESGTENHFDDNESARIYAEKLMEEKYSVQSSLTHRKSSNDKKSYPILKTSYTGFPTPPWIEQNEFEARTDPSRNDDSYDPLLYMKSLELQRWEENKDFDPKGNEEYDENETLEHDFADSDGNFKYTPYFKADFVIPYGKAIDLDHYGAFSPDRNNPNQKPKITLEEDGIHLSLSVTTSSDDTSEVAILSDPQDESESYDFEERDYREGVLEDTENKHFNKFERNGSKWFVAFVDEEN
jgi:hypothetical protein